MNWTFDDFNAELEELNPQVREKAKEIASNLMEQGDYTEEQAIKKAITEAEEWFLDIQG